MADTGIFATTQEVQDKVGANASSTFNVEAPINRAMAQIESEINIATRVNWSDLYSTLNTDTKKLLSLAASCGAAILIINYDVKNFPLGTREAELRMNVLRDTYLRTINILKEKNAGVFIVTPTTTP